MENVRGMYVHNKKRGKKRRRHVTQEAVKPANGQVQQPQDELISAWQAQAQLRDLGSKTTAMNGITCP
jgi:hypothetical protein